MVPTMAPAVHKLPIACSLDAAGLAKRCEELSKSVLAEATAIEHLTNGLRWRFASSPTLLARLGPLIDAERQCCRFLTVTLQAEPNLGDVVLDVTGPDGTREFLEAWH
jgi:hypothetical protein